MTRFLVCVGLLLCLMADPALAATQNERTCAKNKGFRSKTLIDIKIEEPIFDYQSSKEDLSSKSENEMKEWLKKNKMEKIWNVNHGSTVGLTSAYWNPEIKLAGASKMLNRRTKTHCAYIHGISFKVSYVSTISIAKEYEPGSCEFKEIMAHELRHHEVNKAAYSKAIDRMQRNMLKLISETENLKQDMPKEEIQAHFDLMQTDLLDRIKKDALDEMKKDLEEGHAKIDTVEEYSRNLKQECDIKRAATQLQ